LGKITQGHAMLNNILSTGAYGPETVTAMWTALDRVSQSNPNLNDNQRRGLALVILDLVDRGEQAPARLAELAMREFPRANGAAVR
jgi:hypothetical protein